MKAILHPLKKYVLSIFSIFGLLSFSAVAVAQNSMFDPLFGNGGIVKTNLQAASDVSKLLQTKTGKILAIGSVSLGTTAGEMVIIRYNKDGVIDSTFGQNGIVFQIIPTDLYWEANDASLDQDGRIIVAGQTVNPAAITTPYILRFLDDGTPDKSFNTAAKSIGISGLRATGLVVAPDNKVLVVLNHNNDTLTLVQLNTDGSIDTGFGSGGFSNIPFQMRSITRAKLVAGNSLVVASPYLSADATTYGSSLVKISSNGKVDNSFGTNGYVYTLNGLSLGNFTGDAFGRLIIGGEWIATDGSTTKVGIERFKSNGAADSSFGVNGLTVTDYIPQGAAIEDNVINDIGLLHDGRIYLAGRNHPISGKSNYLIARFKANGTPDSTFGNTGFVSENIDSAYSVGSTLIVQADDKPVVSGLSGVRGSGHFAQTTLARYRSASILPVTLVSFNANRVTKAVELQWQVTNETNFAYYGIQRSQNGSNFTSIGKINSQQLLHGTGEYSFADTGYTTGANYYRLKLVDKDGSYSYSKIVRVDALPNTKILLYPNPASTHLVIEGLQGASKSTITICNAAGMVEATFTTSGNSLVYNINGLANGLHFVTIISGKNKQTFKIFKK